MTPEMMESGFHVHFMPSYLTIWAGTDRARYISEVIQVMMMKRLAGWALLNAVRQNGHVVLLPNVHECDLNGQTDAPYYVSGTSIGAPIIAAWGARTVNIQFSPSISCATVDIGIKVKRKTAMDYPVFEDDERLVHEFLHAARILAGTARSAEKIDADKNSTIYRRYETKEEFYATLVANIYTSEKGKTVLRQSYVGYTNAMSEQEMDSDRFLNSDKAIVPLIEKFCNERPTGLGLSIANSPAKFNPIRAYYLKKAEADRVLKEKATAPGR